MLTLSFCESREAIVRFAGEPVERAVTIRKTSSICPTFQRKSSTSTSTDPRNKQVGALMVKEGARLNFPMS